MAEHALFSSFAPGYPGIISEGSMKADIIDRVPNFIFTGVNIKSTSATAGKDGRYHVVTSKDHYDRNYQGVCMAFMPQGVGASVG